MQYHLEHGDCLAVLRTMPDNSVDSIVTDPPYGLTTNKKGGTGVASVNLESPYGCARICTGNGAGGFMGHKWDSDVPSVEIWAECLRVLKPGGYLLAFAGTRTQHRMAVRIEDAGFEIRDMIAWVYGSGFPKSLDVSKAIDKHGPSGQLPFAEFAAHYEARRKASGLTHAQVCAAGGWHGATNRGGTSANWANGYGMPTVEQWAVLQPLLGLGDEWDVRVEREQYEREVIGKRAVNRGVAFSSDGPDEIPITAPGSDAARQWQGWGTALKPALEPITVARKPLVGTVAANVLEHGTGALNIDGCRVAGEPWKAHSATGLGSVKFFSEGDTPVIDKVPHYAGRWPANLIHDGDAAADLLGEAARFFYCAKASRADRNDGLPTGDAPAVATGATMREREDADWPARNGNHHPTVKPTDLMAYLCRLVTPPGGLVLDPFMGSGSTGKAAIREGFRFIGIELEASYLEIAKARISHEAMQVAQIAAHAERQPSLFEVA